MWSAISKFFLKANTHIKNSHPPADDCIMDRNEDRHRIAVQDLEPTDTYDTRQVGLIRTLKMYEVTYPQKSIGDSIVSIICSDN
jgi:hypothetical protein